MALEGIGLVADFIGIFDGLTGLLDATSSSSSSSSDANTAHITIGVGTNVNGLSGADGDLPDARNFGIGGDFLGMVADPGSKVESGTAQSFSLGQSSAEEAFYTLFSANDDAICLAYAFMTMASQDASNSYGFDGSFGYTCGSPWYLSQVVVPGTDYMPHCMWIDANGDQPTTGFQVNWVDMSSQNPKAHDQSLATDMCNTPAFKTYTEKDPNSISYWTNGVDPWIQHPAAKRSSVSEAPASEKQRWKSRMSTKRSLADKFSDILVISDHEKHQADLLCNSTTSFGPDFVNPNQQWFCDMTNKLLHPVCRDNNNNTTVPSAAAGNGTVAVQLGNQTASKLEDEAQHSDSPTCFDVASKQLRGSGVSKRSTPYVVQDWRADA